MGLDARQVRHNWFTEAQTASIYRSLAGVARDVTLRRRLEELATDEERHMIAWAALANSQGIRVRERRPWLAAWLLAALARLMGIRRALALAGIADGQVLRSYLGQVGPGEGPDQLLLRSLISEESAHVRPEPEEGLGKPRVESIRNVIYGVNDGLTATLGVLAGVGGATGEFHVVLVGGLAAMTASAVSMAGGAYLSTKSQREVFEDHLARETGRIEAMPDLEREGLVAIYRRKGLTSAEAELVVSRITQDRGVWLETMAKEELGLDASQFENPRREALVAGVSTLLGGAIPVAGYLSGSSAGLGAVGALGFTLLLCLLFLFLIGSARSFFTGKGGVVSGLEMVGIGTAVAIVTYLVGRGSQVV